MAIHRVDIATAKSLFIAMGSLPSLNVEGKNRGYSLVGRIKAIADSNAGTKEPIHMASSDGKFEVIVLLNSTIAARNPPEIN